MCQRDGRFFAAAKSELQARGFQKARIGSRKLNGFVGLAACADPSQDAGQTD